MNMKLKRIEQVERCQYRADLQATDDSVISFVFTVDEGDITVVMSPAGFAEYMNYRMGPASPLLEAVMKFHLAQRLEFPG